MGCSAVSVRSHLDAFESYHKGMKFNRSSMKSKLTFFLFAICILVSNVLADGMPIDESSNSGTVKMGKKSLILDKSVEVPGPKRPTISDKDLLAYQYCGKDSDCMPVINGCCQCMQGDKFVAINKERLEAFQDRFTCESVLCPKSEPVSYSCEDGVVSCVNHRCLYVEPR